MAQAPLRELFQRSKDEDQANAAVVSKVASKVMAAMTNKPLTERPKAQEDPLEEWEFEVTSRDERGGIKTLRCRQVK